MEKMMCELLEINYCDMLGKTTSLEDMEEIFPTDWFVNDEYEFKIEILNEAIDNNCLIIETELYNSISEGVKPKSR